MPNPQSRMAGRKRDQAVAQCIPQVDSLAGTRNSPMLCASPSSRTAREQALVRLRQAALRRAESRARISATVRENDDYQRFIPEVREFFSRRGSGCRFCYSAIGLFLALAFCRPATGPSAPDPTQRAGAQRLCALARHGRVGRPPSSPRLRVLLPRHLVVGEAKDDPLPTYGPLARSCANWMWVPISLVPGVSECPFRDQRREQRPPRGRGFLSGAC
jgi:hypothetical protein